MWSLQTSIKVPENIQCVNMFVHKKTVKSRGEVTQLIYVISSTFPVKEIIMCHKKTLDMFNLPKDSRQVG